MRIVIAPDSFKESLSAREVCAAIARGIRRVRPDARIDEVPMADGGEGTVDALVAATRGTTRSSRVTGPLGEPIQAAWGLLGGRTGEAVLEMAAASGLPLVPPDRRNPLHTTTYGTGELMRAALDAGARRILIGIGGSATTDGGAGAAQACGIRFLDASGEPITTPLAGARLADVYAIDASGRDPRLSHVRIDVACDVDNPLCGPRGAAAVYGPQKGATPEQVEILDRNLARFAETIRRDLGCDTLNIPGAGAAGGLGAGLIAFFGGRLSRGIELVMEATRLTDRIRGADLVITGEGRLDRQSMMGKVVAGVGGAARAAGVRAVALVGCLGDGADESLAVLQSYQAIAPPDMPLPEAMRRTSELLEQAAARLAATL